MWKMFRSKLKSGIISYREINSRKSISSVTCIQKSHNICCTMVFLVQLTHLSCKTCVLHQTGEFSQHCGIMGSSADLPLFSHAGPCLPTSSTRTFFFYWAATMLTKIVFKSTMSKSRIAKNSIRFDSDSLVTFLPEVRFDSDSELFWFEEKKVGICPCN